jgi:hypothetical protein
VTFSKTFTIDGNNQSPSGAQRSHFAGLSAPKSVTRRAVRWEMENYIMHHCLFF